MTSPPDPGAEWLETDGLGGFASGTVGGLRTRRYHGLLVVATTPPTGRRMLVNGFDAWLNGPDGRVPLTGQRYKPDLVHPQVQGRLRAFSAHPWPTWTFDVPGGALTLEIFQTPPHARTVLRWQWSEGSPQGWTLYVRPFISGRDYHALHLENERFDGSTASRPGSLVWRPYDGIPAIVSAHNGRWSDQSLWYRQFLYTEERARGLDHIEDLGSPGVLSFDLTQGPAVWIVGAEPAVTPVTGGDVAETASRLAEAEMARRATRRLRLATSAEAYLVRRSVGKSIVAGYPWFTDWGRDTFVALRGLCLATGRFDEARDVLLEWSDHLDEGRLPNRFPDEGRKAEYGSVDASLWFAVAAHELLAAVGTPSRIVSAADRLRLQSAIVHVLEHYAAGTRDGIRMTGDGLLAAGEPGSAITWMDARVDGRAVTPRVGKPVEIQALWINALEAGAAVHTRWAEPVARARQAFKARFWNEAAGGLFDVVDVDHQDGVVDAHIRPNQILAVGGLPYPVLTGPRARRIVDLVERELLTPVGLRTLAPGDPDYVGRYAGPAHERDAAYHQGAAWPWLMGAFVDAWIRVRDEGSAVREEARERFLTPLLANLDSAGLGHISELADGDAPHTPRGCPFQAASVGECLRIEVMLT
ncbi:MAG: amylo-alpha-1,6-glucosidase [Vicinamibacterales bacterium]